LDLRCQWATVLIEFVEQVFHTVRELRDRAKTDDTSGAFERVYAPPYTLELLTLAGGLVDVGKDASNRIKIILSFEPEPFDEFI
jgi:hypothetical protein